MKMTELLRYDLPPEIIRLWQERESETLLPLQEMAVKRHNLFDGKNLLLQAPTSSGKTFIGEMAAIQTALRRKKVVYLVPLKALAEEKHADFQAKYAQYGIKVIISTRDHREFDADLESGDFSIAMVVYEKLDQLLVRRPERLQEIELILADELEILSDPERGALVELLLTRILRSRCRLIGMSAVVGEAEKLAQWLQADVAHYDRRPIELRYGVLHEGKFRYRTYNEYSEGEEMLVEGCGETPWETLMENVEHFTQEDEPCLIFVKAKHESRRGAQLLAQRLSLPPAAMAMEKLRKLEVTHSQEALRETLESGVAFHNADLSPEERRIVEGAFQAGEVKVLVSTSTLAAGLNLPAQNVFISSDKWQYDSRFGMPWKTPILRGEYENMGGRAGRYGAGNPFGRSILIAPTPFEQETLWRRYVEGEREGIEPRLAKGPLEDHILRLVASRTCRTHETIRSFLEDTLSGQWIWGTTLTIDEVDFQVRAAINRAIDAGMLSSHEEGGLSATPFGQAVAAKGCTIATARELAAWIHESETRTWPDIDLLLAAAMTPDGRMPLVSLTAKEYDHADYPGELKRVTLDEDLSANTPLNRLRNCNLTPFFEEVRAIKMTLLLMEWLDEATVYDLEEKYHVLHGQIISATEQLGWLLDATAAIAAAFGAQESFVERIEELAIRLAWGLREEVMPLVRLGLPGLNRATLLALEAQGLHTAEALAGASPETLARWTGKAAARTLKNWAQGRAALAQESPDAPSPTPQPAPVLVVDDRHPGEILVEGTRVQVQEKQYRLIRTLAAAPGECVPYESIYDAVWGEAIVEQNQMHFQKRRLLDRVKNAIPHRGNLVTTVPKRGFVLDLAPHEVALTALPEAAPAAC